MRAVTASSRLVPGSLPRRECARKHATSEAIENVSNLLITTFSEPVIMRISRS
jgi:hypothetical protein